MPRSVIEFFSEGLLRLNEKLPAFCGQWHALEIFSWMEHVGAKENHKTTFGWGTSNAQSTGPLFNVI